MAIKLEPLTSAQAESKLSKEEILRYSRHLIMPEVGMEGQLKLKQAKVLLIGTGGLGAPLGLYLAAAGVGRLGLVTLTWWTSPTCSAKSHLVRVTSGVPKLKRRASGWRTSIPTSRTNPLRQK